MTNFSVGVQVQNLGVGLWVTMAGFAVAFVAGIIISTAAALSEQLPKPTAKDKSS
jgi:ABC-type nitrate/sulfonate/bicarbonate transport system permease component